MTVRVDQLVIAKVDDFDYLPDRPLPGKWRTLSDYEALSLVRHIMRERHDCTMIPVVNGGFRQFAPNQYGDTVFIDVTYSKSGWRATYGAVSDPRTGEIVKVQCYMD